MSMLAQNVLFLNRKDVKEVYNSLSSNQLQFTHFKDDVELRIAAATMVIFINFNGSLILMKDRYGLKDNSIRNESI